MVVQPEVDAFEQAEEECVAGCLMQESTTDTCTVQRPHPFPAPGRNVKRVISSYTSTVG